MLSMAIFVERQSDVDRRQMERFLGSFSDCRFGVICPRDVQHTVYLYKEFLGENRLKQVLLLQIILDEESK